MLFVLIRNCLYSLFKFLFVSFSISFLCVYFIYLFLFTTMPSRAAVPSPNAWSSNNIPRDKTLKKDSSLSPISIFFRFLLAVLGAFLALVWETVGRQHSVTWRPSSLILTLSTYARQGFEKLGVWFAFLTGGPGAFLLKLASHSLEYLRDFWEYISRQLIDFVKQLGTSFTDILGPMLELLKSPLYFVASYLNELWRIAKLYADEYAPQFVKQYFTLYSMAMVVSSIISIGFVCFFIPKLADKCLGPNNRLSRLFYSSGSYMRGSLAKSFAAESRMLQ